MDSKDIRLQNLRTLLSEAGSAVALAERANTSAVYLSQILSLTNKAQVGDKLARKLEMALAKPKGWLDTLHDSFHSVDRPAENGQVLMTYPLLKPQAIEAWLAQTAVVRVESRLPCPTFSCAVSPQAFLFAVSGNAMVNPYLLAESLIPQELVLVDPQRSLQFGQLVLVKFGHEDFRVRQYQQDGHTQFLSAFDTRISHTLLPNAALQILGVIVASYRQKI